MSYRYDALGRRIQRVHTVAGSGTTNPSAGSGQADEFVYDGLDLLAMNRGGAVYQQYVHGPGIDQPLALLDYSSGVLAVYYYHADRLGSIRALTDAAQAVAQSYTYTAFGVTTVGTPGGLDQPLRYTAREWDTAAGLYYYRARWYDPEAGRFVSPDPIGVAGGTTNLYTYVGNGPILFVDPIGLRIYDPILRRAARENDLRRWYWRLEKLGIKRTSSFSMFVKRPIADDWADLPEWVFRTTYLREGESAPLKEAWENWIRTQGDADQNLRDGRWHYKQDAGGPVTLHYDYWNTFSGPDALFFHIMEEWAVMDMLVPWLAKPVGTGGGAGPSAKSRSNSCA